MQRTARIRTLLFRLGSFALGGLLLYLALRGVDLREVWHTLEQADYRWLAPLVALTLLSHLIRAWRWRLLLEALPDTAVHNSPTVAQAFRALMIGYMVNYAAPRLGELARAASLSRTSGLRLSSVLGTVVAERLLDLLVLGLALLSVLVLLLDRWVELHRLLVKPLLQHGTLKGLGLGGLLFLVLAGLGFHLRRQSRLLQRLIRRIRAPLQAFKRGLFTVHRTHRPVALLFSTLLIWACYWGMAYLPLRLLHLETPYGLGWTAAWILLVLGAIGVALPAPGGLGSYHYITVQVMVHLFAVPQEPAATYAVLTHAAQMVLYTAVGFLCLLLQGGHWRPPHGTDLEALPATFRTPSTSP
ncbi:MAG: lysylphosphatidylglycerol synthase transmembrane domain-containing protein [Rhodothermus sp.]|nr:lysylphosphatidylglycerol synthase transmembrane domain-containing protein [Rhodothermus sp.]